MATGQQAIYWKVMDIPSLEQRERDTSFSFSFSVEERGGKGPFSLALCQGLKLVILATINNLC